MKTLFCDLDNTLLFPLENGSYGIKEKDLLALKKVIHQQLQLVIASGRPAEIKDAISSMIGDDVDAIGFNGQQIMTSSENIVFASFPVKDYLKITDWMKEHYPQTNAGTTDFDGVYYVNDLSMHQPMQRFKDHYRAGIIRDICELPSKEAFKNHGITEVAKLLIYIDPQTDSKPIISNLMQHFGQEYDFIRSNKMFIEGLCKGHSKKTGIEAYIKMHNLDLNDCYCAGDADNDIDMFELFKNHSFCMKAGSENARNAAAVLVDGLAEAIEKICKNGRE